MDIKTWENNKIKTFFLKKESKIVDFALIFETQSEKNGLLNLLSESLFLESLTNNEEEIILKSAEIGTEISTSSTQDFSFVYFRSTNKYKFLKKGLAIFLDLLKNPKFDEKIVNRTKEQIKTEIDLRSQDPSCLAFYKFKENLFKKSKYAQKLTGDKEDLDKINTNDLYDCFLKNYSKNNLKITIVGDLSTELAYDISLQITDVLNDKNQNFKKEIINPCIKNQNINFKSLQNAVVFGNLSFDIKELKDLRLEIMLANHIFGGSGLNSRLFKVIRKDLGLTYSIYCGNIFFKEQGAFFIEASTENKNKAKMLIKIEELYNDFLKNGIKNDELLSAKDYFAGSFVLKTVKNQNVLNILNNIAIYNLDLDYINNYQNNIYKISQDRINHMLRTKFKKSDYFYVTCGK